MDHESVEKLVKLGGVIVENYSGSGGDSMGIGGERPSRGFLNHQPPKALPATPGAGRLKRFESRGSSPQVLLSLFS